MDPLLTYKASSNRNNLYMHEEVKAPDQKEFIVAIQKEVNDQTQNVNFLVIPKSEVPKEANFLPAIWLMKRKRDIKSRKVKKWKARLNIDGLRTKKGFTMTKLMIQSRPDNQSGCC